MNISSSNRAAALLDQVSKVRSFYADPVESLGKERSRLGQVSHATRQQAETFDSQATTLTMASASVKMLAKVWSQGQLSALQEIASQVTAQAANNPFSSIALSTRQNLASVLGDKASEEHQALEGAVFLASSLGNEPAHFADNLNQSLQENYYGLPSGPWLKGEVTPSALVETASTMATQAEGSAAKAKDLFSQASQEWQAVDDVQRQLNERFSTRRDPKLFKQRVEAAKSFLSELDAAAQDNAEITKEMRLLSKETGKGLWIDPNSLLTSYRSQLAKNDGNVDNLDWRKLVGQMERTSFG